MESLNLFNNFITVLSFFVNLAFLIPLCKKIINYITTKRYILNVLGFNNDMVQISHATFKLAIEEGHEHNYITYEALESINNVIDLLHIANKKFFLIENNNNYKNEINIGGFLPNKKTNAYFVKFFNNFVYLAASSNQKIYDNFPIDQRMIKYSAKKTGFLIDDIFLETTKNTDYAFLIKLVKSDFKNDNAKTVHIIFGGGNIGTVKATEYLLTHCKQIYDKYGKNHYFFAIEINKIDASINYFRGIIDLTEHMFCNDN